MPDPASGRQRVLVTRPPDQASDLAALLEERGLVPIVFPVLEILPRERADVEAEARGAGDAAITIFISPNAVRHGLPFASGKVAAIGPGTARCIEDAGRDVDIVPAEGYDSEHLLAEPSLEALNGTRVRIVRGNGGRELLRQTLEERGADVHYLEVYSRQLPSYRDDAIEALERDWIDAGIDFVIAMSVNSLKNLERLLPRAFPEAFARSVLVTPAARVLKEVEAHYPGCRVILADGPSAAEIADAIGGSRA